MAIYKSTNGNDHFVGTAGDDIFYMNLNPFGVDTVDGGAGVDTLNIDYSLLSSTGSHSTILADGGSFHGMIVADYANHRVEYQNIEKLNVTLTAADDSISVTASPLASTVASLSLNGGAGFDKLDINFAGLDSTTFVVGKSGAISSNHGTYSQFEQFEIWLGGGNNTVTTGAGDDIIFGSNGNDVLNGGAGNDTLYGLGGTNILTGGAGDDKIWSSGFSDTVDGGAGNDQWIGDYATSSTNLAFGFNGFKGLGGIGGTKFSGIEDVSVVTGSGNDSFNVIGAGNFAIYAGAGTDTLTLNQTGVTGQTYGSIFEASGTGGYSGSINGGADSFDHVEKFAITFSDDDNHVSVDAAPLGTGAALNLNGGSGSDTLALDLQATSSATFNVAADGSVATNVAGLAISNFETFDLTLGAGTNSVVTTGGDDMVTGGAGNDSISTGDGADTLYGGGGTNMLSGGAGNDVIYSTGGSDTVDGGADLDAWHADYSSAAAGMTFSFDQATAMGTLTDGTTVAGCEYLDLTTGAGNDLFQIKGGFDGTLHAGAGFDTLAVDQTGFTGLEVQSQLFWDSDGYSGFFGNAEGTTSNFAGIEAAKFVYGGEDDQVHASFSAIAAGLGHTLSLDGGAGYDRLELDLSGCGHTSFTVKADGTVSTNLTGLGVGHFEDYYLTLGNDNNTVRFGAGDDEVHSGSGKDVLDGGAGNDILDGGAGVDTVTYATAGGGVVVDLAVTDWQWTVGSGADMLTSIERLIGSHYNDTLAGDGIANMLTGDLGDDKLVGMAGNDTLVGGAGSDILDGGAGNDMMTGGSGADRFVFGSTGDFGKGSALDHILDFASAEGDKIDLSAIDADTGLAGDQGFTFVGTSAFTTAPHSACELRYEAAGNGDLLVQGDVNHDGTADFSFVVHAPMLAATDFVL